MGAAAMHRAEYFVLLLAVLVFTCIVHINNSEGAADALLEETTSSKVTQKESYEGHALVRFETPMSSHGKLLHELLDSNPDLDLWQEVKGSHAIVRVPPKQMRTINKWSPSPLGLHQIIHSNVQQLIEAEAKPAGKGFYATYHDHDKLENRWRQLAKKYPKAVKLSVLGKTHEGRRIVAIHISAPGTPKNAPEIFVQGGQHAREWIAGAATTYVAEALANGQSRGDKAVTNALKHTRITLVPLLNPDGYQYSRTKMRMWRKNRNYKKGHAGMCVGVDPNRNWYVHQHIRRPSSAVGSRTRGRGQVHRVASRSHQGIPRRAFVQPGSAATGMQRFPHHTKGQGTPDQVFRGLDQGAEPQGGEIHHRRVRGDHVRVQWNGA